MTTFAQSRDAFHRAFCHDEITHLTPIYEALERDTLNILARYQQVSKHDKTALESKLSECGFQWQAVSARLHAAHEMLARLEQRENEHVSHHQS